MKTCSFILNSNGHYSLKKKHKYYGQVQMGMSMLNLNKCYLSLYSSYDDTCIVIEIYFDYNFSKKMLDTLKYNYFSNMLHSLCEADIFE